MYEDSASRVDKMTKQTNKKSRTKDFFKIWSTVVEEAQDWFWYHKLCGMWRVLFYKSLPTTCSQAEEPLMFSPTQF